MKIRYCVFGEKLIVVVPDGGTLFLFEGNEKELVSRIIEGLIDMDPENEDTFLRILRALHEDKETRQ